MSDSTFEPTNDYFKVELTDSVNNPGGFIGALDPEDGVREGTVIGISDEMAFFGFNTYMFDKSLMDQDILKKLYDHYKSFLGKRVCWPERSEAGALMPEGDKKYAYIKMSAVMAREK